MTTTSLASVVSVVAAGVAGLLCHVWNQLAKALVELVMASTQ